MPFGVLHDDSGRITLQGLSQLGESFPNIRKRTRELKSVIVGHTLPPPGDSTYLHLRPTHRHEGPRGCAALSVALLPVGDRCWASPSLLQAYHAGSARATLS